MLRVLILYPVSLLLAGCGLKGPLFLPEKTQPVVTSVPKSISNESAQPVSNSADEPPTAATPTHTQDAP